ncbi:MULTISPECIES: hypothetical protein [unclassified Empedobacter]|uniref:hypothetical protein n=1 Tax=Empedobacter TaxID=59734 RepID=UPI0025765223|nr:MULTISPECIES: hypothetical protein [unclassified Empedobacter]MDM1137410.1 hypothetical protein [Empedobacter sp. R132-2]
MKIFNFLFFILIILTLNSCFLAITGAPHSHSYKEISDKNDLKLNVFCTYLIKQIKIGNVNPNDSIYIQSSSLKKLNERKLLNHNDLSDSMRFYNLRIGDIKFHSKKRKDTINIIRITSNGDKTVYKFLLDSSDKEN